MIDGYTLNKYENLASRLVDTEAAAAIAHLAREVRTAYLVAAEPGWVRKALDIFVSSFDEHFCLGNMTILVSPQEMRAMLTDLGVVKAEILPSPGCENFGLPNQDVPYSRTTVPTEHVVEVGQAKVTFKMVFP